MSMFNSLEDMVCSVATVVKPPERLSVAQAAEKYRYVNNPGSFVGEWSNDETPYMVEPMDECASTLFRSVCFVGPAQSGKTDSLIVNYVVYTSVVDPRDVMIVQTTAASARDFAKRRIERLFRASKDVGNTVLPGKQNKNIYDTRFKAGTMLTLSWPSITELSGKPISSVALTDYDRMEQDVDGEGSPYALSYARTRTFGRHGMAIVESSPGFEVENPRAWIPASIHEAPPTQGILAIYNMGDRRRWYWPCPHCDEAFEGEFHHLRWPESADKMECAEQAYMVCPKCGGILTFGGDEKNGIPSRRELNIRGRWVKDGELWLPNHGTITGKPVRSTVGSFWLKGVAAAFADWKSLVFSYLSAMEEYEKTGDQQALKTTTNVDQGLPFTPIGQNSGRLPEEIKARALDLGERIIPDGVRFLIASIDVQRNKFVCQVQGIGVGGDTTVIDRFNVLKSERLDEDGERLWVNPGSYEEDWRLLVDAVLKKTYPLADGSGRSMQVKVTLCDSGGREGVTTNAYNFWRWLRDDQGENYHRRFQLIKGASKLTAPRVQISYPDSDRGDRRAGAMGEVPILLINTNVLKDALDHMLGRTEPGGGLISFPKWLPDSFYTELTVESRTAKGWVNPHSHRNESWDLLVYSIAGTLSRHVNIEKIDWDDPPGWAAEWDENDLVSKVSEGTPLPFTPTKGYNLADLGKSLA